MISRKSKVMSKVIAIWLVLLMVGNITFAVAISDISSTYWASTVIQNMTDKDILDVYEDGSFKPETTAYKAEAIIVIYKAAIAAGLVTTTEGATLASKYESQLENLGIPKMLAPYGGDVYPALGYALEHEIVVLDEVKYFVSGTQFTSLSKIEATVYFGKALNYYKQENLNKIISLSYKDASEISFSALKYVDLLIGYDIVSDKGDSQGNFNPKMILNRAILAVFANGYYNAVTTGENAGDPGSGTETGTNTGTNTGTETEDASTTPDTTEVVVEVGSEVDSISGTITDVFVDLKYLEVKGTDGKTATYNVGNSDVFIDGTLASLSLLADGLGVKLSFEDGVVVRIDVPTYYTKISGNFNSLSAYVGTLKDFRSLSMAIKSGGFDYKRIYSDCVVYINGKVAKVEDLQKNDYLNVYYDGYNAKLILAYSSSYVVKGYVNKTVTVNKFDTLSITLENGSVIEAEPNATVNYSSVQNSKLSQNDILEVTLAYGKVKQVKYLGSIRDITGIIKGINIQAKPEISLDTGATAYQKFTLPATLEIIGEDGVTVLDIYDLRLEQFANIHIGFNGVERLTLGKSVDEQTMTITVTSVITTSNILIGVDSTGASKTITISSELGISASDYKVGDKLEITGKKITDFVFEAEKIKVQ